MRLRLAGMVFVLSAPLMAQIPASNLLMQQAAGTSRNPQSASMAMLSTMTGNWMLHAHGQLFLNRVDETGPRGHSKTFSTNWFMGSAMRSVGRGLWSTTGAWGRVYKEVHDRNVNGFLAESVFTFLDAHHLTTRVEVVDKDELFPHPVLTQVRVRRCRCASSAFAPTLSGTRLTCFARAGAASARARTSRYEFPTLLQGFYGDRPHSLLFYLRARLGNASAQGHHHHAM